MAIEPDVPHNQPSAFPSDLPPRSAPPAGASWKERNFPGMRNCWSFSLSSYSLKDVDGGTRLRRICMLVILALRTVMSVLSVVSSAGDKRIAAAVIYAIIGVIGIWFIAWCLARIGDVQGERRVFGLMIGRWHFDIFLFVCAIIHAGLVVSYFFWRSPWGLQLTWIVMWFLIFAVAWITGWDSVYPAGSV